LRQCLQNYQKLSISSNDINTVNKNKQFEKWRVFTFFSSNLWVYIWGFENSKW
jgi:hypothetical protein